MDAGPPKISPPPVGKSRMPAWAQAIGQVIPVTHFLRIVRGALLKGQGLEDMWAALIPLAAFVLGVTALAMARYRRTLD